jgi:hypothetical protein
MRLNWTAFCVFPDEILSLTGVIYMPLTGPLDAGALILGCGNPFRATTVDASPRGYLKEGAR